MKQEKGVLPEKLKANSTVRSTYRELKRKVNAVEHGIMISREYFITFVRIRWRQINGINIIRN